MGEGANLLQRHRESVTPAVARPPPDDVPALPGLPACAAPPWRGGAQLDQSASADLPKVARLLGVVRGAAEQSTF